MLIHVTCIHHKNAQKDRCEIQTILIFMCRNCVAVRAYTHTQIQPFRCTFIYIAYDKIRNRIYAIYLAYLNLRRTRWVEPFRFFRSFFHHIFVICAQWIYIAWPLAKYKIWLKCCCWKKKSNAERTIDAINQVQLKRIVQQNRSTTFFFPPKPCNSFSDLSVCRFTQIKKKYEKNMFSTQQRNNKTKTKKIGNAAADLAWPNF